MGCLYDIVGHGGWRGVLRVSGWLVGKGRIKGGDVPGAVEGVELAVLRGFVAGAARCGKIARCGASIKSPLPCGIAAMCARQGYAVARRNTRLRSDRQGALAGSCGVIDARLWR